MLTLTNPRLRRFDVVVNSFHSCISNASEKFSRTPKVSMSEMPSEPGMFFKKFKGTVSFKQLQGFADTHSSGEFNKQVDMISGDMKFINFAFPPISNLPDKELTIHSQPIKLKGVHCIFNFPDKMESILSKAVLPGFQIHFLSPETYIRNKVLTISDLVFKEPSISASFTNNSQELNFEDGDSSQNLKVWVSSPWM